MMTNAVNRMRINCERGIKVSPQDQDLLAERIWTMSTKGYAFYHDVKRETGKSVFLHRIIMERILNRKLVKGEISDHINRVKTDNRRTNLRVVDLTGNSQNRRLAKNNKTGFRGVFWLQRNRRFMAVVKNKGRLFHAGSFLTAEEAGIAAANKRKELGFLGE